MALAIQLVLGGSARSESKMVMYPDRSVDEHVQAFWHTLWAEMRGEALTLP
jgi:hypothetical protein